MQWVTISPGEHPALGIVAGDVQTHVLGEDLHEVFREVDGPLAAELGRSNVYAAAVDQLSPGSSATARDGRDSGARDSELSVVAWKLHCG